MKQLEVQILGQSYLLGCPPGGEMRLLSAVEKVDSAMCKIRDAGKVKARDRIAVLAALNLAFDVPDAPAVAHVPTPTQAATLSPSVAAPPPLAPATSGADAQPLTPQDQQRVTRLLAQLDAVLASDGRLI